MRIAVLLDHWQAGRGGLEVYLQRVLPALAQRHEVHFLARGATRRPPQAVAARETRSRLPRPRPWRDLADAETQARAAAALGPDRVLSLRRTPFPGAFWQPHDGSAPDRRAAMGRPAPGWRDRLLERLEERTLRQCAGLLAVSPMVAAEIQARRPGLPCRVLPPPLPAEAPAPAAPAEGPPRVLFCGQDARRKDAPAALAWFRALRRREPAATLTLWSRSTGHLERVLGASAGSLAAEGVELRGWDAGFRKMLPGAHLLLLPTRYDPCALAGVEAAACGVPVLTTLRNGFAALTGPPLVVTAPAGDPEAAAAAAAGLLELRREDAGREAAGEIRRRFSLERHLEGLQAVLAGGISP